MMSHLTHVVIVAIMAATTQVTHAAPTIDLNQIDEKFGAQINANVQAISAVKELLLSYVDKVNKQIEANKEKSEDMQYYIDALKDKVNVLEGDKTAIDAKLHNLERTVGNVTSVLNDRHICPSGYDYVKQHDRCLMFVKTELSYENAEDECQKHSSRGHLAFVESKEVSDYLLKQKDTNSADMEDSTPWIALRYDDKREEWRWLNAGLDFGEHSWTNWAPRQPNMKNNCVKLDYNGKWMTSWCGKEEMAWCQATPAHVDTLENQQPKLVGRPIVAY